MDSQNINWRLFQPENYRWDFTFQDDDLITGFKIIVRNDNNTLFKTIYTLSLLEMKNGSDVDGSPLLFHKHLKIWSYLFFT